LIAFRLVSAGLAFVLAQASPAPDALAEQAARIILEAPAATNGVWPGYSLPDRSFAISVADGTYVSTRAQPPEGFVRRGALYYRPGPLPGFGGILDTDYRLGDLSVTVVVPARTAEDTALKLYHEAFHAFQGETMTRLESRLDAESMTITAEQAASVEIERRLLREALQKPGLQRVRLVEALSIRHERGAAGGEAFKAAERAAERHEGVAEYVGLQSIALAMGRTPLAARSVVERNLGLPLRVFGGSPDERLIRTRSYATGAALALLLDELSPDWKRRIANTTLDELAAAAVSFQSALAPEIVGPVKARHDFDRLARNTNPPWGSLTVMKTAEFDALSPYRVVIELTPTASPSFKLTSGGGPTDGMHRPAPGIMLLPKPVSFHVEDGPISITVTARPVRLDGPPAADTSTVTILLRQLPAINGEPATSGDRSLSSLDLTDEGVRVKSTTPVRVVIDQNSVKVARTARWP
jgi:hypothetical protein